MLAVLVALTPVLFIGFVIWLRFSKLGRQQPGEDSLPAVLTLTGVSPEIRPAGTADEFCAVSGFLRSPELAPTEVYQRWALGPAEEWPRVGQEISALYEPGKAATHWWVAR